LNNRKTIDIERDEEVMMYSSEPKQVCENPIIGETEPSPSKVNRSYVYNVVYIF
jgi:hypothetical protein